jgi:hypothetical protein
MLPDNAGLAWKYWPMFEPLMEDGESLLTAYTTISVDIGLAMGRGVGDGTLGITDRRVIYKGFGPFGFSIRRSNIKSISRSWVAIPNSRQVTIGVVEDGSPRTYKFIVGTGFSKDMTRLLG